MPIINFTITGTLSVPKDTVIEHMFDIILPNGDTLRIWPVVELNDTSDLSLRQLTTYDCWLEYGNINLTMEEA
jgi:hypothetical protein